MNSSICRPTCLQTPLKLNNSLLLPSHSLLSKRLPYARKSRVYLTTTRAQLSTNKETVLKDFHERRALKVNYPYKLIISYNFIFFLPYFLLFLDDKMLKIKSIWELRPCSITYKCGVEVWFARKM